ncbi:MAG TPA: hypothetical protein VF721_23655 [Pyrinomonadaceae bacterium]|jgi:hypothetical protein
MNNTLLSVLIGGGLALLGVIITNFYNRKNLRLQLEHQKQMESAKLRLSKLEELHSLLSKYILSSTIQVVGLVTKTFAPLSPTEFNAFLELLRNQAISIGTLINIYTPELKEKFDRLLDLVNELNSLGNDIIQERKPVTLLNEKTRELTQSCYQMLKYIEEKSREQAHLEINK